MPKLFQPEQLKLSNGIPVILQHYDGPVAATYWWVRAGSADEAPAEAGFAHFLEHMLFKDAAAKETGRASTGQTAQAIESLGGDINAYTSFDQTVYHVTCAAHHWEKVLDAFGSMAKPQKFLKSDFEREREVILEELRKNEDSPGRQLFQAMFSQTFKKHPYGKPVIGYPKTLKAATVGELEAFYRRNYVPEKMGLVLVGPVQDKTGARRKNILKYLEKHYGSKVLKPRPSKPFARPAEKPFREPSFTTRAFDVKTPSVIYSFRAPDLLHAEIPALDLLGSILGMGELSRLYQRLFYQTSLATEASGGLYVPRDPGMLYFQAEVDSVEKIEPASREIFSELRRICDEGPTAEELSRVIINSESERLYATQSADGMAGRLGFLRFILGDLDYDQKYLEELHLVDEARIRDVARTYLDYRRMSGVVLLPKDVPDFKLDAIQAAAKELLSPAADEVKQSVPAKKKLPSGDLPVEFFELPSGLKVVHFDRPQSHVFSIYAAAPGGLRLELAQKADWGLSSMMSLTWTKGTSKLDSRGIATIAEGHAASIDGFAGRNTVGLQMTGLARDWAKLSSLFGEVLLDPSFPESEVDHSRRVAEDSVRGIEDHSSQLCSKLFLETLFEHHPYGKLTTGSLESLARIRSRELREYQRAWVRPDRMVISVSGAVKRSVLESWLKQVDEQARSASKELGKGSASSLELARQAAAIQLADEPALKAPRWVERALGREQTHIIVGGLGLRITDPERHAIRLLHTLLGGQSGRLFIELREKKSLAYTVSPISFEGLERGYIGTYIACAPAKRQEAIDGIRSVLEKLAEKGPTASEMNRAKEFYLGRRAMDLQGDSSLAAHYGLETLYGIAHLREKDLIEKIRKLGARDLQAVCRKFLIEPHLVTSVV